MAIRNHVLVKDGTLRGHRVHMDIGEAQPNFIKHLRWAMHYLYDPVTLRRSVLAQMLAAGSDEPGVALREILLGAIQALKPPQHVSAQSSAWRVHQVLQQRFVEQYGQKETSADLGISARQLRRQENLALAVLTDFLCARYDLNRQDMTESGVLPTAEQEGYPDRTTPSRKQELEWLQRSVPGEPVNIGTVLQSLVATVLPITQSLMVKIDITIPEGLPMLSVHVIPMRQALLAVLTACIRCVPCGSVLVNVETNDMEVRISIRSFRAANSNSIVFGVDAEGLRMAAELARAARGSLTILSGAKGQEPLAAAFSFRTVGHVPVLVIDDNADTLYLLERYLSNTRYRFLGARSPEQALSAVQDQVPQVIVLDVMLPGVDGWELLQRLREHPRTRATPVIVCTILPQEHLAQALGAAGFMRKPIMRRDFLSVLDQQVGLQATEPS